jgi:hypothetical protein
MATAFIMSLPSTFQELHEYAFSSCRIRRLTRTKNCWRPVLHLVSVYPRVPRHIFHDYLELSSWDLVIMCQSVSSIYTCKCAGENYIQRCKFPGLKCVENLQQPVAVSLGVPCSKHTSKRDLKAAKIPKKERDLSYPPTSFNENAARGLSTSQLRKRLSNRSTVPPRTPTSTYTTHRRASTSSSICSDASVAPSTRPRSARSPAESYTQLLNLGTLSLEQSTSLAEAQATLRNSIEMENRCRALEGEIFDNEIVPIVSRQPSQRIKQTILSVVERRALEPQYSSIDDKISPRTANTHPALRGQLSPHPRLPTPRTARADILSPLSPATITRNTSMKEKAARIRASLERERKVVTNLENRPASATATSTRKPISPIKKRKNNSWAARPSHTRATRNADRLPQTPPTTYQRPSRVSYGDILEDDAEAIKQLTDRERYELFLEKDRKKTAVDRQRRAERKARGGYTGELREKTDGICTVM